MGNTLSDTRNSELYKPMGEENAPLLRKKIHDILMQRKETINGREIDINRRKIFCRMKPAADTVATNMNMGANDYLNVSLPGIANTISDFVYNTSDNAGGSKVLEPVSKISTFNVPLKVREIEPQGQIGGKDFQDGEGKIQKGVYNDSPDSCTADITDICAKQLYDNDCVIKSDGKLSLSSAKRCYKTPTNKLISNKVNLNNDTNILKQLQLSEDMLIKYDYYCRFLQNANNAQQHTIYDNKLEININPDIGDIELWRTGGKYWKKLSNDRANKIFISETIVNKIQEFEESGNIELIYKALSNMIIINYIYRNENIYKTDLYSDKVVYTGEPLCGCLNSIYGPNFNKYPSTECKVIKPDDNSNTLSNYLLGILNNPDEYSDWLVTEARSCLQWEAKFLTNINEELELEQVEGIKGNWMTPTQCDIFREKWSGYTSAVKGGIEDYKDNLHPNKNSATIKLLEKQYTKCQYNTEPEVNMYKHLNVTDWEGESTSKYSIRLNGMNIKIKGGNSDPNPYQHDKICKTKFTERTGTEQRPYYVDRTQGADVTCTNTIEFNNVNIGSLSIGSILQNNVCGNIGNVKQYFITPDNSDQSFSNCPANPHASLFLSGFNVRIDGDGSLHYDIFSNINGNYKKYNKVDEKEEDEPKRILYVKETNKNIILELKLDKMNHKTVFMIHHAATGLPRPRLSSRKFAYNKQTKSPNENEEMCIDRIMKNIYIFSLYVNSLNEEDKSDKIQKYVLDNLLENIINPNKSSDLKTAFYQYIAQIPEYSWTLEDTVEGVVIDEKNPGIISHGGDGLFTKGQSFFNTELNESTAYIKNHFYIYENSADSEDIITGRGKFISQNDTLTPYMVISSIEETIVDVSESYSQSRIYEQLSDDDDKKVLNVSNLINKIKEVGIKIIIFSPAIYRYLLFSGNKLLGASDVILDSFIGNANERLILSQNNLQKISATLLPSGIIKTEGNREWTLVNMKEIDSKMGELHKQKIQRFTISDVVPKISLNLSSVQTDLKDHYLYTSTDNTHKFMLENNRWVYKINNEIVKKSQYGKLDYITDYISKDNTADYWVKDDKPNNKIEPVVSLNLRFKIKPTDENGNDIDNNKITDIKNNISDMLKSYFKTDSINSEGGILHIFGDDRVYLWYKIDIINMKPLVQERYISKFVDFISQNSKYIVVSNIPNQQIITEIVPVTEYPGANYTNITSDTINSNLITNRNASQYFNFFNKGLTNKYDYINGDIGFGKFRIELNTTIVDTALYDIVKIALGNTLTHYPIYIKKIERTNQGNQGIEGFDNMWNYKELLDNITVTYEIGYLYDIPNSTFKSKFYDYGPITDHIQYKNSDGNYETDSKPALEDNQSTPVGTIINDILQGLRNNKPDDSINIIVQIFKTTEDEIKVLYNSADDETGIKIKKLTTKETVKKVYDEYSKLKLDFKIRTNEVRLKYFNTQFNATIINLIMTTEDNINNSIQEGESSILTDNYNSIDDLLRSILSEELDLVQYNNIPTQLNNQINTFNSRLESEIRYYKLAIRRDELSTKYGSAYESEIDTCNTIENCDSAELNILKKLIKEGSNKDSKCSTIEQCKTELKNIGFVETPTLPLTIQKNPTQTNNLVIIILVVLIVAILAMGVIILRK